MREELKVLDQLNPMPDAEATGWSNTDEGERTLTWILERTEGDIGDLEKFPHRGPVRRSWVPAIAAALGVVVVIGLPALLRGSDPGSELAAAPFALDVEYVWPEGGFAGGPEEVAREFAETLGWSEAQISVNPSESPDGQVWVFIQQPGREELPVLTIPINEELRALDVIGPPGVSIGTDGQATTDSQWVGFRRVVDATMAEVHVRLIDPDRVDVIEVPTNQLGSGRVIVGDISQIGSVVVVYRDEAGDVVTASGRHFAPIEATEPRTPEEILADDVVTESEYRRAAMGVLSCLNEADVQAVVEFDARGHASFTTIDGTESTFNRCHQDHLGGVDLAWADQNTPSPEREIAFYNYVVSCVEAQTGEDYGEVEAVGDTRATDAAIADAPDLYDTCFDQTITRYPEG